MNNIENMSLTDILNYLKDTYGDETTNLYIRCLDCDEYIPICEWNNHENLIELEICNDCNDN